MPGEAERKKNKDGEILAHEKWTTESYAYSCTRGPSLLSHERVLAIQVLLDGGHLVLRRDHNGVLVHQLAGGVGERGQGQVDSLHLALVHPLVVLLLHVLAPESEHTTV